MAEWVRWAAAAAVAGAVVGVPAAYFRAGYAHAKRLRVVADGKVYRSGQLTAGGFRDAIRRYRLRTVINLQEEARDPLLPERWRGRPAVRESDVCRQLGVRYVALDGGVLDAPGAAAGGRPAVVDDFLAVLDDPASYPVLFHCKAGLHRTGLMAAVYRMAYDRRPPGDAVRELRANGFGTFAATDGNLYLRRFVLGFAPGRRAADPGAR